MAWLISGPIHLALSFLISSACRESIAATVVPQVGSVLSWAGQVLSQLRRRPCLNTFHRTFANFASDTVAQMAIAAVAAAVTVVTDAAEVALVEEATAEAAVTGWVPSAMASPNRTGVCAHHQFHTTLLTSY